jgi:hypothetical protein
VGNTFGGSYVFVLLMLGFSSWLLSSFFTLSCLLAVAAKEEPTISVTFKARTEQMITVCTRQCDARPTLGQY